MSSDRWLLVEQLFEKALEIPPSQHREWLEENVADDPSLRVKITSLLRSHQEAESVLDASTATDPFAAPMRLQPGAQIGAYRLLSHLGEGGMSTVFLAQRDDGSFSRKVAVKVVRRGMESAETLLRLRTERQILAELEHPNIARLYDGGKTAENLPFFVLEWVDGQPIDAYCDQHRLDIGARIHCFLEVCEAVSFAHRRMIVHRDLKPNNVLVTRDGVVKLLLDFGIAKWLTEKPDAAGVATAPWVRLLTPQYASPEQVRGEAITTGTDVYSLGVLLFRLLTGRLPFRLAGRSLPEIEETLSHRTPPRPSTVVAKAAEDEEAEAWQARAESRAASPVALRRLLAGDLDNILLKALATDLDRRYPSVDQFAEDLRRFRSGRPVLARPQSSMSRFGKLIRRHRVAALAVAVAIAAIAYHWVHREIYIQNLSQQRHRAEAALATQEEVESLTQELFQVAGEGEALTVGQAVDRAAQRIDRVVQRRPELGADLLDTAGVLFLNLGEPKKSGELLARAVELRRQEFGNGSLEHAETLSALGVANVYGGDPEAGLAATREALQAFRQAPPADHPDLILPLNNLVLALCRSEPGPANQSANHLGHAHRRILAEDIVTVLSVRHRGTHGRRRPGDGIAPQDDDSHLCSPVLLPAIQPSAPAPAAWVLAVAS